jgi:hypothetical protein
MIKEVIKQRVEDINNLFIEDIKAQGLTPIIYFCEKCGNATVRAKPVEIIPGKSPLCHWCLGNVSIKVKEKNG